MCEIKAKGVARPQTRPSHVAQTRPSHVAQTRPSHVAQTSPFSSSELLENSSQISLNQVGIVSPRFLYFFKFSSSV